MVSLRKRPILVALLLCLVAVSSFAVSYSLLASQDNSEKSSGFAVIGGSCCPSEVETVAVATCALEASAQTVAAKAETLNSCSAITEKTDTVAAVDACCAVEETANTANADTVTQTQVDSVQ